LPAGPENVWLAPASRDLAGAVVELPQLENPNTRLTEQLGPLDDHFDVVLIDCPPALGPITVNALVASDRVIIPVQAEYLALEGLVEFLDTIKMVRQQLNPSLELGGILVTMHDERTRLAQQVEAELRDHFSETVFRTVIPRTVRVAEAPSYGIPVTDYSPTSRGSEAYLALADEVAARG
jgi:chromosome partitioning protein